MSRLILTEGYWDFNAPNPRISLAIDDPVLLKDHEGNSCKGEIVAVDEREVGGGARRYFFRVVLDMSTWTDGPNG